jgi:hypothetical protein
MLDATSPALASANLTGGAAGTLRDVTASSGACAQVTGSLGAVASKRTACLAGIDVASGAVSTLGDATSSARACLQATGGCRAIACDFAGTATRVDSARAACTARVDGAGPFRASLDVTSRVVPRALHRTTAQAAGYRTVGSATRNRAVARLGAIHLAHGSRFASRLAVACLLIAAIDVAS